ncbi:SecC motif-containing protein [Psychromonas sp. CNPT3]|uniref:PBPRA1643 family SWIM/SEC-C metal-binding motif protein n=1 Tax=Psychromonas sp. CNPT3 TaxID=314282 RepID=UPI00006E42C7|nr:PBPRA1643 family SWIM/SEC-C metal-binding motif protein [Psychromonas sp. CNPT3]AGH80710.1 SecC motif-containing protein [Psychromonas sp. CNPT3]
MSDKFFFKGRKTKKPKHTSCGFNTKRELKSGSEDAPLQLSVQTQERKEEVLLLLKEHELFASIEVNADRDENIEPLHYFLNKPQTVSVQATPKRNALCPCGSGKKYKKCCA